MRDRVTDKLFLVNKALVDKETRRRGNKVIVKDKGTTQIRNRKIITFYR